MAAGTNAPDWRRALAGDAPVLVTGAAGFIGHAVSRRLLAAGIPVAGLDNLDSYYDPALKRARIADLAGLAGFTFEPVDLTDRASLSRFVDRHAPRRWVHLAAQPGVRHSITHPEAYTQANVTAFLAVLEECRRTTAEHLVYASSSSVYGGNAKLPFSVDDSVDHPVSLYAATKKANELMAHTYSHLYALPATGLRFFTVYGPWGRPDMAVWLFTEALFEGRPIRLFNHGRMRRDFTYVDDIVEGVLRVLALVPEADPGADRWRLTPATSWAPHRVFNIGNSRTEELLDMVAMLEELSGREAVRELTEMQPGDVEATWADMDALASATGWRPSTPLREGLARFVNWYRDWRGI